MTTSTSPLAIFLSRYVMQHERWYPHPIDLVWEAVSKPEHLDVWLLPECTIEPMEGGFASFGWGSPAADAKPGTVSRWEPPTLVRYQDGAADSYIEFRLAEEGDGTRLYFTQSFDPNELPDEADYPGGDKPAGPDSPWLPGFCAGFHLFLDRLAPYLAGEWTAADQDAWVANALEHGQGPEELELIEIYRPHIAANCPSA